MNPITDTAGRAEALRNALTAANAIVWRVEDFQSGDVHFTLDEPEPDPTGHYCIQEVDIDTLPDGLLLTLI